MTQAVKRACDACHRRKVKCDGINPCRNCGSAQLSCTYNAIPQKKGPKGSRAKVISELRENQRQTSLAAKVHNRITGLAPAGPNPSVTPSPGLLSSDLIKDCLDYYFSHMYINLPILNRAQIEQEAMRSVMEQSRDSYCLIASVCALVLLQPGMTMPASPDSFSYDMMPGTNIIASNILVEEALKVRRGFEYLDNPTLNTIATSYMLFACYHATETHTRAWHYLREAGTIMHMVDMHKEETYMSLDPVEASRRRRLFWLVYATERAYSVRTERRPVTLEATINLPTLNDDPSDPFSSQLSPFISLVSGLTPMNATVVASWHKVQSNTPPARVASLNSQMKESMPVFACQDPQLGEFSLNQDWLKSTAWQLSCGYVNRADEQSGGSFQYPSNLARELEKSMAAPFPNGESDLVGTKFMERLMEVTTSVLTSLSQKPASRNPFSPGPRELLEPLLNIVGLVRHGEYKFLPLLLVKVSEAIPQLTSPTLLNAPETVAQNLSNIDIFDGFGGPTTYAPQSMMSMEMDYERKMHVPEFKQEQQAVSSMAPSAPTLTPSTHPDSSQSFASSSPSTIMSPGMDFTHQVPDFNTPISEMGNMMNPLASQNPNINSQQSQQPPHLQTLQNQCLSPQQLQAGMVHSPLGQNMPQTPTGQIPTSLSMNSGSSMMSMGRPTPQRANTYMSQMPQGMSQGGIPRTIGDFHNLQRAASDMSNGLEMDFGAPMR